MSRDPRLNAFCSPNGPEIFHSVTHRHEIWKEDPFDVDIIHKEARNVFQRILNRATTPPGLAAGRIVLVLGESGAGKTHLMRAFRNHVHGQELGYVSYMQMTSGTEDYSRYVLSNTIDSFDHPYFQSRSEDTALLRLSSGLVSNPRLLEPEILEEIRNELVPARLEKLVRKASNRLHLRMPGLVGIDSEVLPALLYLQHAHPRIKNLALRVLRCEDLSRTDRELVGGIVPMTRDTDPARVMEHIGRLVWMVHSSSMVICLDQLEDLYTSDGESKLRFRRAMRSVCDLADRVPSSIIVVSCLEDFYDQLRDGLTRSMLDRMENDPAPIVLKAGRRDNEISELVGVRLQHLNNVMETPNVPGEAVYPFTAAQLGTLAGQRTRDVLDACRKAQIESMQTQDPPRIGAAPGNEVPDLEVEAGMAPTFDEIPSIELEDEEPLEDILNQPLEAPGGLDAGFEIHGFESQASIAAPAPSVTLETEAEASMSLAPVEELKIPPQRTPQAEASFSAEASAAPVVMPTSIPAAPVMSAPVDHQTAPPRREVSELSAPPVMETWASAEANSNDSGNRPPVVEPPPASAPTAVEAPASVAPTISSPPTGYVPGYDAGAPKSEGGGVATAAPPSKPTVLTNPTTTSTSATRPKAKTSKRVGTRRVEEPRKVRELNRSVETSNRKVIALEQAWNDFRVSGGYQVPETSASMMNLLGWALERCPDELSVPYSIETRVQGPIIEVDVRGDNLNHQLVIGLCDANTRGGGLLRELKALSTFVGSRTGVVIRTTAFPSDPNTESHQELESLVNAGWRRVVVEDSAWRAMAAMKNFRQKRGSSSEFLRWLQEERPLTQLHGMQRILDIDALESERVQAERQAATTQGVGNPTTRTLQRSVTPEEMIIVGSLPDSRQQVVAYDTKDLKRHVCFLGGPGSGRTNLVLGMVEKLLRKKIPVLLVDRSGELASYANDRLWGRPVADPALEASRKALRESVEMKVYSPGDPRGDQISMSIVPRNVGGLGALDRDRLNQDAASALADLMGYGLRGSDSTRRLILSQAIKSLHDRDTNGQPTLQDLVNLIAEEDEAFMQTLGRLDVRNCDRLVRDLETLRLNNPWLNQGGGQELDFAQMMGLGEHAVAGKTRLTVVSTRHLGDDSQSQFWVSRVISECSRYAKSCPVEGLQAAVYFDEAERYLRTKKSQVTKDQLEDALKRFRWAGIGILLGSDDASELDLRSRENIQTWFLGRTPDKAAIRALGPLLSECKGQVAEALPNLKNNHFFMVRGGAVTTLRADSSIMRRNGATWPKVLRMTRR